MIEVKVGAHLFEVQLPESVNADAVGSVTIGTEALDENGELLGATEQTIFPGMTAHIAGFGENGASLDFSTFEFLIQFFSSEDGSGTPIGQVSSQMSADEVNVADHHHPGVITNNNAFLMAMGEGSRIEIHAADAEKDSFTKLTMGERHSKFISVDEETGWEVGDRIVVGSTRGKRMRGDEQENEYVIEEVSEDGKSFTLDKGLIWYPTTEVETQTDGERVWEIDMRTDVALLSRNVKIQGDEDSMDDGYGGHTMIMHGAEQHISGAEFYRMGQIDEMGRYPIHWHMNDDVAGQYIENSSVHESFNKGITVHGSHNARLEGNVIYDHIGHGVFLEDGSEYGSQILENIVMGTNRSETGEPIPTDASHVSSYWVENGNTVMIGNIAAGSDSTGFWITPAKNGPHGASKDVYSDPDELETYGGSLDNLVFRDNVAHTNEQSGLFTEGVIGDDLTVQGGRSGPGELLVENFTAYNSMNGLWAGSRVFIDDSVFAGNLRGTFFHQDSSVVNDSLYIGQTETTSPYYGQTGAFLYRNADSGFNDVHFINFDNEADTAAAIDVRTGAQGTPTWVNDVTLDNVDLYVNQHERDDLDSEWASDNRIVDLDGSLTGEAGTFVTRKYINEQFGGFETEEDARFEDSYLTKDGFLFQTRIQHQYAKNPDGSPTDLLVTREDGVVYDQFAGQGRNMKTMQTAGENDQESAYLVEFSATPSYLNLNAMGMREGAAVVYQLPNFSRVNVNENDADVVGSLDEMFAAEGTSVFHDGSTIFVRVVAEQIDDTHRADDPHKIDAMIDNEDSPAQAFLTDIGAETAAGVRLYGLRGVEADARVAHGEAAFDPDMMALLARTDGVGDTYYVPELQVPDGMSSPTYFGRDIEMTEAQALADVPETDAGAIFDIDYDKSTKTVVIEGEFYNLASDATMLHLHSGAPGQGGSVIGNIQMETADGRNGLFRGEFQVNDAQEAALIAGNTYVNLHSQEFGGGALRGQVEVVPARQFELIDHESTSDTTEITAEMMRWSEMETWGGQTPDANSNVVIHKGMTVVLDQSVSVKSILIAGGELIVEDEQDLELSADWVLVTDGGLFQAGTEDNPHQNDFTLTLEGDDKSNDVDIMEHMKGNVPDYIAAGVLDMGHHGHDDMPMGAPKSTCGADLQVPAAEPEAPAAAREPMAERPATVSNDDENIFEEFFGWLLELLGLDDDEDENLLAADTMDMGATAETMTLSAMLPQISAEGEHSHADHMQDAQDDTLAMAM